MHQPFMRKFIGPILTVCVALGLSPAFAQSAEDEVLAKINAARIAAGCPALKVDPRLQAAAKGHARAMAQKDFFSHTGKNGSKFGSRIKSAGYSYSKAAENIAGGQSSAADAVAEWMGSSGHRKNILTCAYEDTGIAMIYQENDKPLKGSKYALKYYWVQVFAKP